jgi:hypothetical protein
MSEVEFKDHTKEALSALQRVANQGLIKVAEILVSQTKSLTPVKTGALRGSIQRTEPELNGTMAKISVGTPLMYGLYLEYGTGEHAENGQGRKGGWVYIDARGKGHFTKGLEPRKMFRTAARVKAPDAMAVFAKTLKGIGKW